jgi:hypothetical protein
MLIRYFGSDINKRYISYSIISSRANKIDLLAFTKINRGNLCEENNYDVLIFETDSSWGFFTGNYMFILCS